MDLKTKIRKCKCKITGTECGVEITPLNYVKDRKMCRSCYNLTRLTQNNNRKESSSQSSKKSNDISKNKNLKEDVSGITSDNDTNTYTSKMLVSLNTITEEIANFKNDNSELKKQNMQLQNETSQLREQNIQLQTKMDLILKKLSIDDISNSSSSSSSSSSSTKDSYKVTKEYKLEINNQKQNNKKLITSKSFKKSTKESQKYDDFFVKKEEKEEDNKEEDNEEDNISNKCKIKNNTENKELITSKCIESNILEDNLVDRMAKEMEKPFEFIKEIPLSESTINKIKLLPYTDEEFDEMIKTSGERRYRSDIKFKKIKDISYQYYMIKESYDEAICNDPNKIDDIYAKKVHGRYYELDDIL